MTDVVHGCLQSLYLLRHLKDSMLSSPQQGNNHLLWSAASSDYPPDLQLQLLQEEVFDGIGKYAATCIRLCVRCEKFQYVQYLLANKALLTRQYEAGLRKLQSVLDEALTYIKSMMKRVLDSEITTVKFRLTHAKEVSRITLQLFAMESNLLLASARKERDFEEERMQHKAEDLEVSSTIKPCFHR